MAVVITNTDVEYYIDGKNLKDYSVYVSSSQGLVGRLARKDALSVEWDGYHGICRDKARPVYKERTITLECFIQAESRAAYVDKVNAFFGLFDGAGNHRLKVEYDGQNKPLVYEVELHEDADPTKTWGKYNSDTMIGKFKLKLIEDEPVKKVLRFTATTTANKANINVTSAKLLTVYWGDGTHTANVYGTNKEITHTYSHTGTYEIVIAGVIEDITNLSTNATIVWNLLK